MAPRYLRHAALICAFFGIGVVQATEYPIDYTPSRASRRSQESNLQIAADFNAQDCVTFDAGTTPPCQTHLTVNVTKVASSDLTVAIVGENLYCNQFTDPGRVYLIPIGANTQDGLLGRTTTCSHSTTMAADALLGNKQMCTYECHHDDVIGAVRLLHRPFNVPCPAWKLCALVAPAPTRLDNCVINPCENGGTCVWGTTDYTCACPSQCRGATCDRCGGEETVAVSSPTREYNRTEMTVFVETDRRGLTWIAVMRRNDGSEDFVSRDWADYKAGFGNLTSEFWIGNDNMYYLTNNGSSWTVRFDLKSFDSEWRYAEYTTFSVDSEAEGYKLHIGGYTGDAGDSMWYHDGAQFTTRDVDHDIWTPDGGYVKNCAVDRGGWWYKACLEAKLTGQYGQSPGSHKGIHWKAWLSEYVGLSYADMKIRAV